MVFKWINLELIHDEHGKVTYVPISGELTKFLVFKPGSPDEYWGQRIHGQMVAVLHKHNVIRLLVPTLKQ